MATAGPSASFGILLLSGLAFATILSVNAASDADVLLKFKAAISDPAGALRTWTTDTAPCTPKDDVSSWAGVICDNGTVLGLQLEDMRLSGTLDLGLLTGLAGLRTLSFMNNSFRGAMPDVKRLGGLRSIYLSMNELSGPIAGDAFDGMWSLKKVHLSRNGFSGPIPASLAAAPKLLELKLDGNRFEAAIPDFRQKDLQVVNVSGNSLEGPIPAALAKMDADLFAGNKGLCGAPLSVPCASSSPSSSSSSKKYSSSEMAVSLAIALVATLGIVGLAFLALRRQPSRVQEEQLGRPPSSENSSTKKARTTSFKEDKLEEGSAAGEHQSESGRGSRSGRKAAAAGGHEQGRLVFTKADGNTERFELHDLLKSSAEVLGAGKLGCSYKATLTSGNSMVVKRFRDMNRVGKEDFEEHMRRLGRLSHPNLLPLVAYYYRKEEKLLVTRYVPNRSVAYLLHGDRKPKDAALDWPARLKIVKGVGRALIYLYDELSMLSVPHGHLKSSNVLLGESWEPLLTDYALVPVTNQSHAANAMEAFRSPERKQFGRTSKKSDVWSFGLLILELLTGKNPADHGKDDLASWAADQPASADKAVAAFDSMTNADEAEMTKLLKIGLACCESNVDKRWELKDAVDKIEELTAPPSSGEGVHAGGRDDGFSSVAIN